MKLGQVDPAVLRDWSQIAWENVPTGREVELHVTPYGWELRAPGADPISLLIEPERLPS